MNTQAIAPFRRRVLAPIAGGEAVLSYYGAGFSMAEHSHDCDQRSIILSGTLAEDTAFDSATPSAMHMGVKPAGLRHANRYGPHGALILAFNTPVSGCSGSGWRLNRNRAFASVLACALSDNMSDAFQCVEDIYAQFDEPDHPVCKTPPCWLWRVREALREAPDETSVQALAKEAGVHRVYLSRLYSACFGLPISLERRRARLARSVRALIEKGARPVDAAMAGGFSDQPHFTRTLREDTGLTPSRLSALFGN